MDLPETAISVSPRLASVGRGAGGSGGTRAEEVAQLDDPQARNRGKLTVVRHESRAVLERRRPGPGTPSDSDSRVPHKDDSG